MFKKQSIRKVYSTVITYNGNRTCSTIIINKFSIHLEKRRDMENMTITYMKTNYSNTEKFVKYDKLRIRLCCIILQGRLGCCTMVPPGMNYNIHTNNEKMHK